MITEEEWTNLTIEIDLITQDRSNLPYMWLSATEGDKDEELARRNETDLVKNETKKLEAGASQISAFNLVHKILCNAAYLSLPQWPKDKVNARIQRPIREAPLRIMSPLLNAEEFNGSP